MSTQTTMETPLSDALAASVHGVISSREILNTISAEAAATFPGSDDDNRIFYQIANTSMELRFDLSMQRSVDDDSLVVNAAYVNADYCNEYDYDPRNACIVRTNLAMVDPDGELQERIRRMTEDGRKRNLHILRDYNGAGDTPSIEVFKAAGLENIVDANLQAYLDAISAAVAAGEYLEEVGDLQGLIDNVNAMRTIEGYGGSGDAHRLTMDELTTAGAENILEKHLEEYKKKIAGAAIASLEVLQQFVEEVNFAVVQGAAKEDISLEQLGALGLDHFLEANFAEYVSAMPTTDSFTREQLQKTIDSVNLGALRDYSLRGDAPPPAVDLFKAVGLEYIVDDNLQSYNEIMKDLCVRRLPDWDSRVEQAAKAYRTSVVNAAFFTDAEALQNLILAVNMDVVRSNPARMTLEQLKAMGVEEVKLINANLGSYSRAAAEEPDGLSTLTDLRTLIDHENTLSNIRNYRFTGKMDLITVDLLNAAGMEKVEAGNLAAYKTAILKAGSGFPENAARMQALIHRVNAEHADLVDMKATGADNILDARFTKYITAVSGADSSGNTAALQALVDMENALAEIRNYCMSNNASDLTKEQLKETGVDDFMEANFENYRTAIAFADAIPDIDALQGLVNYINAIAAGSVGIAELKGAGLENAVSSNLAAYRIAGLLPDISGMKESIDNVNLQAVNAFAVANAAGGLALEQLTAIRKADDRGLIIIEENLAGYRSAVASADSIPNVETLEKIIDAENALAVIRDYRLAGDASELTLAQLHAAGVENVDDAYLEAYRKAIAGSVSFANLPALQALINEVNDRA